MWWSHKSRPSRTKAPIYRRFGLGGSFCTRSKWNDDDIQVDTGKSDLFCLDAAFSRLRGNSAALRQVVTILSRDASELLSNMRRAIKNGDSPLLL